MGLENSILEKKAFEPIVRIGSPDFQAIKLDFDTWRKFVRHFDEIEEFFTIYNEESLLDKEITIPGYTIRFMISFSERAFEVVEIQPKSEEKDAESSQPPKKRKKWTRSLVFKWVSFERLRDLRKCIDCRIRYLYVIKRCMPLIIDEIVKYVKNKMAEDKNTYVSALNVKHALQDIDTDEFIISLDCLLKKNDLYVANEDINLILQELITLHLYSLVCAVNESFNK